MTHALFLVHVRRQGNISGEPKNVLTRKIQYLHDETAAYMADGHHMPEPITDAKDVQAPIFYAAIQKSSLSPSDKTIERVAQEIRVLIGAGGDTTSRIVVNAIFHLLANPEVLARLRKEIMQVMPEIHSAPSVKTLKQLPLLVSPNATCRINES